MERAAQWDWNSPTKQIPLSSWQDRFEWIEEYQASPDGESVAAIVKTGESEFNVCVNGEIWPEPCDKAWYLRYSPDGRLTAIVSKDGEWTLAVDGAAWENRFGYAWNTLFSADGAHLAVAFQRDMAYGMACDDTPWEQTFPNLTNPLISLDGGRTAAAVQMETLNEGEIHKYQKGIYSAAVGGIPWETRFVNVWKMALQSGRQIPGRRNQAQSLRLHHRRQRDPLESDLRMRLGAGFQPGDRCGGGAGADPGEMGARPGRPGDLGATFHSTLARPVRPGRQAPGGHRRSQVRPLDGRRRRHSLGDDGGRDAHRCGSSARMEAASPRSPKTAAAGAWPRTDRSGRTPSTWSGNQFSPRMATAWRPKSERNGKSHIRRE